MECDATDVTSRELVGYKGVGGWAGESWIVGEHRDSPTDGAAKTSEREG